jgi:hypothetical protein
LITKKYSEREEAFWQRMILPEEDRDSVEWKAGYRWFRSANVIPIEHWRRAMVNEEGRPAAA